MQTIDMQKTNTVFPEQLAEKKIMQSDGIGSVELLDAFGSDLTVADAARVSFNKKSQYEKVVLKNEEGEEVIEQRLPMRDAKLIHFLAEHKHITPFFHPQLQFRIKMPIFVAREWFRSVIGFARNEVSRRYIKSTPEYFVPDLLRKSDANIKQGSLDEPVENHDMIRQQMKDVSDQAVALYESLLASGVCPEQARIILPQGMYTEFIETASLSAYARIVNLRKEASAQREIQWYARAVEQLVYPAFPVSWDALMKHG